MDLGLWPWHNTSNTVPPVQPPARHILTRFLNSPQNWKPSQCCIQPPTQLLILPPSLFSSSLPSVQLLMSSMAPSFSAIVWLHWLSWFTSYLSDYISINNHKSHTYPVSHGVPQASVLGTVVFILYVFPLGHILRRHGLHCCTSPKPTLPIAIKTWLYYIFLQNPFSRPPCTDPGLSFKSHINHIKTSFFKTPFFLICWNCHPRLHRLQTRLLQQHPLWPPVHCLPKKYSIFRTQLPSCYPLPLQRIH